MTGKILLTGNRGYIGSVMGPILKAEGYDVVGLDTVYYGEECTFVADQTTIPTVPTLPTLPTVQKDIRDLTSEDLQGFDAVIHLAALSNDPLSNLRPELTYEINLRASVNLARLAKEAGVQRYLFSSSCSMHGAASAEKVYETTPVEPLTPYGESKIIAEQEISALADDTFSPTFLRNGTVYGVSPRLRVDIVLNNLVGWATTTRKVVLYTDGTPWRPLIHVEDVSRAFIAALEAPIDVVHNEIFHVGNNKENYQIRDLAEIVRSVVPGCEIEYSKDHDGDQRTYIADFSKIEQALPAFRPTWNVESGANELYQAYQRSEMTFDHFMGGKYMRLKRISELQQLGLLDDTLRWK